MSRNNNNKNSNTNIEESFCAVTNPVTGQFIDLSQLSSTPNTPGKDSRKGKNSLSEIKTRWLVKGYGLDVDKNFTISICSSPVILDNNDVSTKLQNTTGAYYSFNNTETNQIDNVSIGDFSTKPVWFGNKKLTLQYDQGSLCPNGIDHKSTLLNFVCDRDITARAQINYIGNMNNCSYFFEVRSIYACPTANKSNEVNVLGIFFGILLVFTLVEICRRWIKNKIEQNSSSSSSYPNSPYSSGRNLREPSYYRDRLNEPHWEFLEDTSLWRKWVHKFQDLVPGRRHNRNRLDSRYKHNGPISLNGPSGNNNSTSSFFRDVETQNDILDQLDNLNESQDNSVRSSVYTDISSSH